MVTIFETTTKLYQLLVGAGIGQLITGGIYRNTAMPEGSKLEDVEVNSVELSMDCAPQEGTSNINIYVPDISACIGDRWQKTVDEARLAELSAPVLAALRDLAPAGWAITVQGMWVNEDAGNERHFLNIRVTLLICSE